MKLQNAGVLWFSGACFGAALTDTTNVLHVNISTWDIVLIEFVISAVVAALAFHPWTSGE